MKYILGLDVGITSVGWCILEEEKRIVDLGVRIFPRAEEPKTGEALAAARRIARGMRRRNKRKKERLAKIRRLFVKYGVGNIEKVEKILFKNVVTCSCGQKAKDCQCNSPYKFRAQGLEGKLQDYEWLKALYHIAVRRGFKSNRKSEAQENKEAGKLLSGVRENKKLLQEKKYRTVGEMLYKDEKFKDYKRNSAGSYSHTIERKLLEEELKILFAKQRGFGNKFASKEFEEEFIELFNKQKHYAEGEQIIKLVGFCTFENSKNGKQDQLRAPKSSYSAEMFALLTKLVSLRINNQGKVRTLSVEEIRKLRDFALTHSKVTYKQARKKLQLEEDSTFNGISYKDEKKDPESKTLVELKAYHMIKNSVEKALGKTTWLNLSQDIDKLDAIAEGLTYYKTDKSISEYLEKKGIEQELIEVVLSLSFAKVIHLSTIALRKLLPFLEQGKRYDEACVEVGYNHYQPTLAVKQKFLPLLPDEITNPVVRRALSQSRKVINAIIRQYGSPYKVNVELARDLSRSFQERREVAKGQDEFKSEKDKAAERLKDLTGCVAKPTDILKFRLWEEQKGCCPYSGESIELNRLAKDDNYAQVDHIIPYSRCFNDSYNNKVLVLAGANQNKGNRTPYEFLGQSEDNWHKFTVWVEQHIRRGMKKRNLLFTGSAEELQGMKERNLNDTRYISRFLTNFLQDNLLFHAESGKKSVVTRNGQMTAFLRHVWGLNKERDASDLHHAMDAAVIAAATNSFVQKVANHSKNKEIYNVRLTDGSYVDPETGEILTSKYRSMHDEKKFPQPWESFRSELKDMLSEMAREGLWQNDEAEERKANIVSRLPNRKATGALHQETIRSKKTIVDDGIELEGTAIRTPLVKVTLKDLENMVGKERDVKLYKALKKRLQEFDNKPEKAFSQPFYKPTNDGLQGPLVNSIKVFSKGTAGVEVHGGLADNDRMVRIDVYYKDKKYYLVPVYVMDIALNKIKNKAIAASKSESDWTLIDKSYDFLFSLYYNDLVEVDTGKELIFGYYIACDRSTGGIDILCHDKNINWGKKGLKRGIGVKTAKSLRKFTVDVLGKNLAEVKKEKPPYELA